MNKRNFIWNMLGSGIYSLASVLFFTLAKRFIGEDGGAQFYMAFTTGQMLLTIGYFEIRPFQVTDGLKEFLPEDYFGFRCVTSAIMLLAGVAVATFYAVGRNSGISYFIMIIFMCIFKMSDGVADVFEGEFQRNGRIDISGKSMAFRTLFSLAVFSLTAFFTKNIYITAAVSTCASLIGVVAVILVWHKSFEKLKVSINKEKLSKLFKSTILLFIGSAMCMWIWNGTKYVVEWNLTNADIVIYGIIFTPTMVINLASSFLFKPMLTTLTEHYNNNNERLFNRIIAMLSLGVVVITAVTFLGAWLLGVPVLSWWFDVDIAMHLHAMLVLIVAGGFNALSIIFYYALMVMRKQSMIFAGYGVAFVASIILPVLFVRKWGINGAAYSYLIVMILQTLVFGSVCRKAHETKESRADIK